MIIEKTFTENMRYNDTDVNNFIAEGEITVTITLNEYRNLLKESVENKQRKEHESWLEQYNRANTAENRVKELEVEVANLYKQIAREKDDPQTERSDT